MDTILPSKENLKKLLEFKPLIEDEPDEKLPPEPPLTPEEQEDYYDGYISRSHDNNFTLQHD